MAEEGAGSLRYDPPARRDLLAAAGAVFLLVVLVGALGWLVAVAQFAWGGAIGGVLVGLLLVVAWSLRDGLLQGEPRLALGHRIALASLVTAIVVTGLLWLMGSGVGATALLTAGSIVAAWLLFVAASTASVNRAVRGPLRMLGTGGGGRALIVYHSAHGGFMRAMQEALAAGLVQAGWQVTLSPASPLSPGNLADYQLLVLGSPCYNRGLARPIVAYLDRLGDLRGQPVVLVITGFNATERALAQLRERVALANGHLVDEIELWTARPNGERDGTREPVEIMHRAGARVARTVTRAAA